jgi:ectoine hydroxylase
MKTAVDSYPSRGECAPGIQPRHDPVVYAREDGETAPIPRERVDAYARDGFLILEELFTPEEVAGLQAELLQLRNDPLLRRRDEAVTEPDSGALRSIFRVHELSALFARLVRDPRLLRIAQYVLGDEVYVHQSRLNYKPGFRGREFYWHSDFETWHVEDGMPRMRALSMSIALTDNSQQNGPLLLIPGSHRHYVTCGGITPENHYRRSLKKQEYGVPDDASLAQLAQSGGIVAAAVPAGSVIMFDCNTMHGSNSNITPQPRSNVFFCYNALSNRLQAPFCARAPRPEFIAARQRVEPLRETRETISSQE